MTGEVTTARKSEDETTHIVAVEAFISNKVIPVDDVEAINELAALEVESKTEPPTESKPEPSTSQMIKNVLFLAGPSTLSVFLETVMEVINTLFIGRLGDATLLAALGLAHISFNLLAL